MKKLGFMFAAAISVVSLGAMTASAGEPPVAPYGDASILTFSDSTVAPGASFTVTVTDCTPGETVTFTLDGGTESATCSAVASASATLTAPTAPGTYLVAATGAVTGPLATATLTVVAPGGGELPATGSDSAPTVQIATGLLAGGAGLAIVGGLRRRRHAST